MEVCNFEIAKKLKEKGFDCKTRYGYLPPMPSLLEAFCDTNWSAKNGYSAPTIAQVLKWLREVYHIHFEVVGAAYGYNLIISDTPDKGGTDRYYSHAKDDGPNDGGAWDSFEDCANYGIEYVLNNLI